MNMQIPVKLPTSFEDAVGYPRGFRWVAFFWEPCGDEAMYDDGYCSADCNWWGFLQFVRHPKVKAWLSGFNLGSSDEEATHYLLCDLEGRDVFVGEKAEVQAFLRSEIMKYCPAGAPATSRIELTPEDIKEFVEKMRQVPSPSIAEIEEKMKRDKEAVDKMLVELS